MVKAYCNVDAIVEQLLWMTRVEYPCLIDESGMAMVFTVSGFRRAKGRLKILGHNGLICSWRLSERTLDAVALRIVLS